MFIRERFPRPNNEAKTRIAELERKVAALKRHQDETHCRTPTETFPLWVAEVCETFAFLAATKAIIRLS